MESIHSLICSVEVTVVHKAEFFYRSYPVEERNIIKNSEKYQIEISCAGYCDELPRPPSLKALLWEHLWQAASCQLLLWDRFSHRCSWSEPREAHVQRPLRAGVQRPGHPRSVSGSKSRVTPTAEYRTGLLLSLRHSQLAPLPVLPAPLPQLLSVP